MARIVLITALIFAATWASGSAQSTTSCTNALMSMSPCLNYITGNSSSPASACCSQLASVVGAQPQCLCQVLNGGGSGLGLAVNRTQALALPGACNVQTPPLTQCNAASPAGSPAGSTDPADTVPSGPGSKTTDGDTSDGSSTKMSIPLLFGFLAAAYASAYGIY